MQILAESADNIWIHCDQKESFSHNQTLISTVMDPYLKKSDRNPFALIGGSEYLKLNVLKMMETQNPESEPLNSVGKKVSFSRNIKNLIKSMSKKKEEAVTEQA